MSTTSPGAVLENPYAGQGAVVLDIGGDVGALVVTMPASMLGTEVEIRPLGHGHGHLAHVAVVDRPVRDGSMPSLVFGGLEDGGYELFEKGHPDAVTMRADVVGGQVSTVDWPT
jgi:hypothetical protein